MRSRQAALTCAALLLAGAALAGSVSGRLLDSEGKPVEGATVAWYSYRSGEETLLDETNGKEPPSLGETKTDPSGRFSARWEKTLGLVSVRALHASHPGVLLPGPYGASEDLTLSDIALPPARRIAGRVVDEAGKPVAGARVEALGSGGRFASSLAFAEEGARAFCRAVTGGDGGFALAAAPEGNLVASVRAGGFFPGDEYWTERDRSPVVKLSRGAALRGRVTDPKGKPAAGAIVSARGVAAQADESGNYALSGVAPGPVLVRALWKEELGGRKRGLNLRRGEEAEVPIRLTEDSAISGVVLDERSRRPLAGASVWASEPSLEGTGSERERSARTDARGRFRIAGLAAGVYGLQVAKRGFLTSAERLVEAASPPAAVSFALSRAASVAGRVVDEGGDPVPGAEVGVVERWDDAPRSLTGPDGRFRINGVEPSPGIFLEAKKRGFVPAVSGRLAVTPEEMAREVALVLRRGLSARGRVVNAQGERIAGARVHASPRKPGGEAAFVREIWEGRPDSISGKDGAFSLQGLEEGDYTVRVAADGYALKTAASLPVAARAPNEWPPLVLAPAAAVSGTVTDSEGRAIPGARLGAFSGDELFRHELAGDDGRFRLNGFSPGQEVSLSAAADGYAGATRRVTAPAENMAIALSRGGTLSGGVEDASSGRPLSRFSTSLTAVTGFDYYSGNPGSFQSEDGSFELPDIPAGNWKLAVAADGYRIAETDGIEVAGGETREGLRVRLEKGLSLEGRALDPGRRFGVPNASVVWRASRGSEDSFEAYLLSQRWHTVTDADGHFRFEGLPPGKIALRASHPEYPEAVREVDLGESTTLDLVFEAGGVISGRVVGREGAGIRGAAVFIEERTEGLADGRRDSETTDGPGTFLFARVHPGQYRIWTESAPAKDIALAEGELLSGVVLERRSGGVLRGRVTGLPAGRLTGLEISLQSQGVADPYSERTVANEEGEFLFRDVPAGQVALEARTRGNPRRSARLSVEAAGAGEQAVEVLFEGESRLSGRILRGERPATDVFVTATPEPFQASRWRSLAQTDEEGRYVLPGLEDGPHLIRILSRGIQYRRIVTVSGDTAADIAIPSGAIRGRVTDAVSGKPIGSAVVERAADAEKSGGWTRASTDSNGFYSLESLDPGAYRLAVRKEGYRPQEYVVPVGPGAAEVNAALQRAVP